MGLPTPRHAYRIAAVEVRRGWRNVLGRNPVQVAVLGVAGIFWLVMTAFAAVGGYIGGSRLAAGAVDAPLSRASLVPAGAAVTLTLLTAYVTVVQVGDLDHLDGLLTTVPHRDVVGGLLVTSYVRFVGLFLPPLIAAAVGVSAATGSPSALGLLLVTVLAVTVTGHAVGSALGQAAKYLLGRSAFVARHKVALGTVAFTTYLALLMTNTLGSALLPAADALRGSPVSWYADLALLTLVDAARPTRAAGAVVLSAAVALVAVRATVTFAGWRWYGDGADHEATEVESRTAAPAWLIRRVGRPTAWVVRKNWLRARRSPIKLVYVAYPLFLLVSPVREAIESGAVTVTLPVLMAVYGAWATGAAFTLNPLGDEGAALPVTLTSTLDGAAFVAGHVLSGVLLGGPPTVLLAAVLAAVSPLSPLAAATVVVTAGILAPGAAAIAALAGMTFPKYETTTIARSRAVVVPSTWAFITYSLGLLLLAAPATVATHPVAAGPLAAVTGLPLAALRAVGLGLTVVLVAVAGRVAFRRAAALYDDYDI
ncbi:MAG: hypothetical protein ABEJ08_03850 [Halobacteriaceae archaeon]